MIPVDYFYYSLFTVASYIFGALPFMILIGHFQKIDLSREPDLHQALWYRVGRGWGLLGFLLDVLKGVLPVVISYLAGWSVAAAMAGGLAALCGQMWPVFRHFDGERGNTVSLGLVTALCSTCAPVWILIVALVPAAVGFLVRTTRRWKSSGSSLNERLKLGGGQSLALPLGVIIGFATTPLTSLLLNQSPWLTAGFLAMLVLLLVRRLTAGLRADLRHTTHPGRIILNRLLYDRSVA